MSVLGVIADPIIAGNGSPEIWVFSVMLGGLTFGVFLHAASFIASGKYFTQWFTHH